MLYDLPIEESTVTQFYPDEIFLLFDTFILQIRLTSAKVCDII